MVVLEKISKIDKDGQQYIFLAGDDVFEGTILQMITNLLYGDIKLQKVHFNDCDWLGVWIPVIENVKLREKPKDYFITKDMKFTLKIPGSDKEYVLTPQKKKRNK